MIKTCVGVLLAATLLGCSSNSPPGASLALDVTLDDSSLAGMQNVSLIRAGDRFMLAGYENGQIRWGSLSLDGKLTQETGFAPPQPPVGPAPVFAATKKNTPGDQFIAILVVNSATVSGRYDPQAFAQVLGDPSPGSPVFLDMIPDGADPAAVQIVAGAEATGNLGFVAWGVPGFGAAASYRLLPADPTQTTSLSLSPYPDWQCLTTAASTSGLSFGVVTPLTDAAHSFNFSNFNAIDIDEAGNAPGMTYELAVEVANCRIVGSPAPAGGYTMAFQTSSSIGFATYSPPFDPTDPSQTGTVTTQALALPAATFGDPLSMPRPAWVSSAGTDVSIGVSRPAGPQVYRFSNNAVPHGGTLTLRSVQGQTGPVSAWVASDAVYVTYADRVNGPGGTPSFKRYFMRIESPASLP